MTVAKKTICHKFHTLSQGSVNDCYVDAKNALRENTNFFIVLLQVTVESISCDWGYFHTRYSASGGQDNPVGLVCGAVFTGKSDIRVVYSNPEHLKVAGAAYGGSNQRLTRVSLPLYGVLALTLSDNRGAWCVLLLTNGLFLVAKLNSGL